MNTIEEKRERFLLLLLLLLLQLVGISLLFLFFSLSLSHNGGVCFSFFFSPLDFVPHFSQRRRRRRRLRLRGRIRKKESPSRFSLPAPQVEPSSSLLIRALFCSFGDEKRMNARLSPARPMTGFSFSSESDPT